VLNYSTAVALATRRLAEAEKRLIRQELSLTQIQQRGQDTSLAKEALGELYPSNSCGHTGI
jgi:hypothetical protein